MDVTLIIDNRETILKDMFKGVFAVRNENLVLGDAIVMVGECPLVVFERKTLSDLAASVKDGRYKSQKTKMMENVEREKLYYIIEGVFDFCSVDDVYISGISKKALVSCIINTLVRDNIKVLMTKNVQETYFLIYAMYNRIKSDPQKYLNSNQSDEFDKNVLKHKAKTLSRDNCFENQLCQVPDVSLVTARAVIKVYPSMRILYEKLGELSNDEKLKRLKEIMLEDSKGKPRRISDRVVKNLIQYMF